MFNIVLVEPEIPANTGNIGRTCVVTGAHLHLIEPLGFSLDDHMLKRAGMGYWHSLNVTVYPNWDDFCKKNHLEPNDRRLHLLTKKAQKTYAEACYVDGDFLVLGSESRGLPEELLAAHPSACERIPLLSDEAALDNVEEWSADFEPHSQDSPLLQQDICGNFINVNDYQINALNLSNACAIVLYEALRQGDFAGM